MTLTKKNDIINIDDINTDIVYYKNIENELQKMKIY